MPEGCEICVVVHFFFRHKIPYPLLHDASLTHQTHIWLVVKKTEKSACKGLEKDIPPEHSLVEIQNDLTPQTKISLLMHIYIYTYMRIYPYDVPMSN
jgi:hypothetical protein